MGGVARSHSAPDCEMEQKIGSSPIGFWTRGCGVFEGIAKYLRATFRGIRRCAVKFPRNRGLGSVSGRYVSKCSGESVIPYRASERGRDFLGGEFYLQNAISREARSLKPTSRA